MKGMLKSTTWLLGKVIVKPAAATSISLYFLKGCGFYISVCEIMSQNDHLPRGTTYRSCRSTYRSLRHQMHDQWTRQI